MFARDIAEVRQRPGEGEHVVELLLVPPLPPACVVTVLLPPRRVGPDRLEVPVGIEADPDVRPGRGDCEGSDALDRLGIVDPLAVRIHVLEAAPAATPRDPR